mgnify:CR=1 FL=1
MEYKFVLYGAIADSRGNKLHRTETIAYTTNFQTRACNHDSTDCADDIEPPSVLDWYNGGTYFEVEFSEVIDESTITQSTIYLMDGWTKIDGVISTRNAAGHTVVKFSTVEGVNISGMTGVVSPEIKDTAGNRTGVTYSHTF